jgi:ketosteroid isomerase-like protein
MDAMNELADRLFAAIEAGDSDALGAMYADDVRVWHNTDHIEMTKEQNLASLDALAAVTVSRRFSDVRRHEIDGGFVQQHVMHLDFGTHQGELPACLVVMVEDGLVTRVDEYFDNSTVAAFGRSASK